MKNVTDAKLRNARAEFRELLSRDTPEPAWQKFFAANPFVLSRSLPLRLEPCDILPMGRPGRSEPDFLIYPGSRVAVPTHGLIELKTHRARVTSVPRKNVVTLSSDAQTGKRQLEVYDRMYDEFSPVKRCVSFSSSSHLFIVMGMQEELEELCRRPDLAAQLADLLPSNMRLLNFDALLHAFEDGLPRQSFILVPDGLEVLREPTIAETRDAASIATMQFDGRVYRLIEPQRMVSTLDLVGGDKELAEAVWRLERLTNPKLNSAEVEGSARREGPRINMLVAAPFIYGATTFTTRFRSGGAAFYGSADQETCIAEHAFHFGRFAREFPAVGDRTKDMHEFEIRAELHDLRALERATSPYLSRNDYTASAVLGEKLRARGSSGLLYPSVRGRGLVVVMFTPRGISYRGKVGRYEFAARDGSVVVNG